MRFKDRIDAGEHLASLITATDSENTVILALPRGGIPLGIELSEKLSAPLDVVLAKKIGHPFHSEFAIGAIAEGGEPILSDTMDIDPTWLKTEVQRILDEIKRRRSLYDKVLTKQPLENKHVILVDDGIATGRTMFAAIDAVKLHDPAKISVAVPIIPKDTYARLINEVDEVIAVEVPYRFLGAVGAYYQNFPQISDQEVSEMLDKHQI